ncbi:MAG: HAMP domain-containing histidine kinase, partial [Deltaproteobacteria bacterium]|nr:HAMP domain-containing histidine kinase [Deltaproteobacteria bacterium]
SKLLELSEQVLRMERLVKTLLDLSILEASEEIQSERINLCKLLTTLSNDYHLLAQNAGIAFYTEIPETLVVSGDTDKLYRAFSNLLDNAVKYNRPGGEIHLTARRAGPYITVMVSNTGPPLPEDELDKLFEPFYRVDKSRARELGGSGLGLPIVKRIVELHNGRITIQGTPEGLTEVQVTLPVA